MKMMLSEMKMMPMESSTFGRNFVSSGWIGVDEGPSSRPMEMNDPSEAMTKSRCQFLLPRHLVGIRYSDLPPAVRGTLASTMSHRKGPSCSWQPFPSRPPSSCRWGHRESSSTRRVSCPIVMRRVSCPTPYPKGTSSGTT